MEFGVVSALLFLFLATTMSLECCESAKDVLFLSPGFGELQRHDEINSRLPRSSHSTVPSQSPLEAPSHTIDCGIECNRRCSKAGRRDRCLTYCLICCDKCHCVPPGTYGNKEACPCYANLKNSKGGPKCP